MKEFISDYLEGAVVIKRITGGNSGHRDSNVAKTVRVTINKEGKAKRVKIYIGSEICKRFRWIKGDKMQVQVSPNAHKVFIITRADNTQQDSFTLCQQGSSKNVRSVFYFGFSYQQPFFYLEKLTTSKILAEDERLLVCQLP